jgi:hypothetical protein
MTVQSSKKWTKDEIKDGLNNSAKWVERGVLALYRFQTEDEKVSSETRYHNGRGFNAIHAPFLTSIAKQVMAGRYLTSNQIVATRKMLLHYASQLCRIANGELA